MSEASGPQEGGPGAETGVWASTSAGLPTPQDPAVRDDLLWQQLGRQLAYYDRSATRNRLSYQVLKVLALLAGAVVTVLAATGAFAVATASLAAAAVVVEGLQQVFQFHANWINYRITAETLRQHGLLYAAGLPPYTDADRRDRLSQALQDATRHERGTWTSTVRQDPAQSAPTEGRAGLAPPVLEVDRRR